MAAQPIYSHPYTVAKQVASLAHLRDRRVYLNMVAGGFTSDLKALNDTTPHDLRYERLTEYTTIIHPILQKESGSCRVTGGAIVAFAAACVNRPELQRVAT